MSGFTQSVKKTLSFDGDEIQVAVKRIKRKHLMQLAPLLPNEGEQLTTEQNLELLDKGAVILDKYVTKFDGLTDGDGNALGIDVVIEESYFQPLLADVLMMLLETSAPLTEAQLGNSNVPLDDGMKDSASERTEELLEASS